MANKLLLGTRKGLFIFEETANGWRAVQTAHLGQPVEYATRDPRNGTVWAAIDNGHWGEKLHRSRDEGASWEEIELPKYPEGERVFLPFSQDEDKTKAATLENVWMIQPGADDQPDRLYLGTNPGGLFVSDDGGENFELNRGLWDHPSRMGGSWFGGGRDTPGIHSIAIHPEDHDHMFVGLSCAGIFETRDGGENWTPRNKGMKAPFLPDPDAEVGHDPHFIMMCATSPDTIWQQNHHGVYVSKDGAASWTEVSQENGPVGFGFPVAVHAKKPDTAWVVPGVSDEQRMAVGGSLCVCRTEDGGSSWTELREGLPQQMAYDVVYRHAMDIQADALAFGSTTGNLYYSADGGELWQTLGNNLPPIYSVRFI